MNMENGFFSLSDTYSSFRYRLHDYGASSGHRLEFRNHSFFRFVSRPSSSNRFPSIIHQTPSTAPMPQSHYFSFPLHLLQQDPFLCIPLLLHFLSNFNISQTRSDLLALKIIFLVQKYSIPRDSGSIDPFRVVADVDHIQNVWVDRFFSTDDNQTVNSTTTARTSRTTRATKSGIKRLKKRKFVNLEDDELGNCVVCHEELCSSSGNVDNKEVIKMHCNHLFHESCIVQWVKKSDSCPLCRSPATKLLKPKCYNYALLCNS